MPARNDTAPGLVGLHILLTRPQTQAETWAQQLLQAGAEVTQLPMLEISPVQELQAAQAVKDAVLKLDEYDKLVFVSQNAVLYGLGVIDEFWPQLPSGPDFFAVGKATASALQQGLLAIDPGFCASIHTSDHQAMNSEALLALPELEKVAGEKIAIVRGLGGRTLLGNTLAARGALVSHIECYERKAPAINDWSGLERFLASGKTQVNTVLSVETLENLCALTPGNLLQRLYHLPLLVPGDRVATQASKKGFTDIICANNATHDSLVAALPKVFDN